MPSIKEYNVKLTSLKNTKKNHEDDADGRREQAS